jgi:mannose/cellobiose epimerase-like protein (N-acyl-D-glucosamine 2-epimerase family)
MPVKPGDDSWLDSELKRLLAFGTEARPGEWLDDDGRGDPRRPRETWLAARALHVRSLGALMGLQKSREPAADALTTLLGPFRDPNFGGWHARLLPDHSPDRSSKGCYEHMFVLLAASTAVRAGLEGALDLQAEAEAVIAERFWDESAGMLIDSWTHDWSSRSDYRGLNGTMHGVEAMLATGGEWIGRAARVCSRVIDIAERFDGRLPEHYDELWNPQPETGHEKPDDPFKPYGATVGHGLEWSRLLLDLEAELGSASGKTLLEPAVALYDRAVHDGWNVDGQPGFVYTTDWSGQPIVRQRMHWVLAEALSAAATLFRRTGEPRFREDYWTWWAYADHYVLDKVRGSWHHELDPQNQPASSIWWGKPDLYHAVQATIVPRVSISGSIAASVQAGVLQAPC